MRAQLAIALVLATLTTNFLQAADATSGYHLLKRVTLGGDGSWDYLAVDADARRLYVTHGTHVQVLDADSYAVVGDIPDTPGVHGVALAPALGRGFTSNGKENTVTIFDLKTLKVIQKVNTGQNPDAILFDPASGRVFTFNGKSRDSTVIDAAKGTVVGTIPLDAKPEFAVADGHGHIYVNLEDKSMLATLDSKRLKVKSQSDLKPCKEPSGLALDRERKRLFSGCDNKVMVVVNADNGRVVTALPIGEGVDATKFDPATGLAFSSNGEGTLTVIQSGPHDRFHVIDNVKTEKGARTMALDEKTHNVFLVTAKFGPAPAPTPEQPHPRPGVIPDSFVLLVFGR